MQYLSGYQDVVSLKLRDFKPPLGDWGFWVIQGLVGVIIAIHVTADQYEIFQKVGIPNFVPVALFLLPVVLAALRYGLAGAIGTSGLVTVLMLPDFFTLDSYLNRWADVIQLILISGMSIFVGYWVEREKVSRHRIEEAREAHRIAEARYVALFESNRAPILVLSPDGIVRHANLAALRLFGDIRTSMSITRFDTLLDPAVAHSIITRDPPEVILFNTSRGELAFRPNCTTVNTGNSSLLQVVLEDVTEERRQKQQIKSYAAFVLRGQEEERRRIAQELHDEPVQAVIYLCHQLDVVLTSKDLPAAAIGRLTDTRHFAENIVADLRELARGLRPPSLDDLGLVAAVRRLLADFESRSGVVSRVRVVGGEQRLRPEAELGLFRIVQEGLRNVERHAVAHHIHVIIAFSNASVTIRLGDDGKGITLPTDNADGGKGLGLLGMHERAETLGGKLMIRARPGFGTVIQTCIPSPR